MVASSCFWNLSSSSCLLIALMASGDGLGATSSTFSSLGGTGGIGLGGGSGATVAAPSDFIVECLT